jgi:ribosomal protein L11 methyltransferase
MRRIAAPRAVAVLSGLLNHEAPAVIAAMRGQGFALLSHDRRDGWSTLTLRKRPVAGLSRGA